MSHEFDLQNVAGYSFTNLSQFNVVLGKNGCGKSHMLKQLEQHLRQQQGMGRVRYVSPERGGLVRYEPGIDQTIGSNPNWLNDQRRKNQSESFRQQSAVLFRRLEMMVLREIEEEHLKEGYHPISFSDYVNLLNSLLDRVLLVRDNESTFKIVDKDSGGGFS